MKLTISKEIHARLAAHARFGQLAEHGVTRNKDGTLAIDVDEDVIERLLTIGAGDPLRGLIAVLDWSAMGANTTRH